MLKLFPDTPSENNVLRQYFIVFAIFFLCCPLNVFTQNSDSLVAQSANSLKLLIWQPKILLELNQFDPQHVLNTLQLVVPNSHRSIKYYDSKNVMPKNYWEMDYRQTSYYTPRIVSDKLAQIMDRPPPDSFVPLPTVALLAASIALQYVDIQIKIEIKATDYIIDEELEKILISLWQLSPQTAKQIYKSNDINKNRTMEVLETDLQTLIDKKLIKRRVMETEPDKYFAAQDILTIRKLVEDAVEVEPYTIEQKQKLTTLLKMLSTMQENSH